jgi:hypothetical protein
MISERLKNYTKLGVSHIASHLTLSLTPEIELNGLFLGRNLTLLL